MRRPSYTEDSEYREYQHPFFRMWDIPLAGVAIVLALIGVDLLLSFHWQPRIVEIPAGEAVHYPWRPVWIVATGGLLLIAVGLVVGMERQIHNWICISVGVGLLTLGASYVALERVTITSEGFAVRRWWGLQSHSWRYDELEAVTVVTHQGRKGGYWMTVKCREKGTVDPIRAEEFRAPRLLYACHHTLRQHAKAKDVDVTAIQVSR